MRRHHFLLAALCLSGSAGCWGGETGGTATATGASTAAGGTAAAAPPPSDGAIDLNGAGATFPYPLYSKWVAEYGKVDARVRINYQSIGSGGGIRQILERTVDFGASDAPMSDEELAKAPGKLHHIPTTLGAVVLAYNVPGLTGTLNLSADAVAGLFLGDIKTWNDPKIAALNPGMKLPADAVSVAYRSDGSGTTAVFTDYLAKVSPAWKAKVGAGKSVKFPVGLGAKGNEGVAGSVKTTPGTLGYVELAYATTTGLPYASVINKAGKSVAPAIDSITAAAAAAAAAMPEDLRVSITDAPGDAAYPISAFTYILVYEDTADAVKGKALAQFLWWAVHDGQAHCAALHYAPLPAAVVTKVEAKLRLLKSGGAPLLAGL
ncbi:MAG TPA: phosphate ABC transporter substrate-binding protein PstS [Myxococcota bacterium]|jgi:phosphate transport system substrate-binding protein|nr:phosphate ABC transporter substrate-binding protein PstS [Myxococcota bacterium]